jgi:hypothetical protein
MNNELMDENIDYTSDNQFNPKQKWARIGTGVAGAAGIAGGLIYDNKQDDNQGQKKGQMIGAGIGGVITAINPVIGAVATPVLSWVGGQIGHDSDTKRLSKKRNNMLYKDSMELNISPNPNQYGDANSPYYSEGGEIPQQGQDPAQIEQLIDTLAEAHGIDSEQFSQMVMQEAENQGVDPMMLLNQMAQQMSQSDIPSNQSQMQPEIPQQPESTTINIERGELLVEPDSMKILKKFKNPSVYSPHSNNKFKEPSGNFVEVPNGSVVIPKKFALRYEKGDTLTKSSILKRILDQQARNPEQNNPDYREENVDKMEDGGFVEDDGIKVPYMYNPPLQGLSVNGIPSPMIDGLHPVSKTPTIVAKKTSNSGGRMTSTPYVLKTEKPNIVGVPAKYNPITSVNPNKEKKTKSDDKPNIGLYASTIANFAPTLWGLANAQKNSEWTKYDENRNYEEYNNSIRNMETQVPVDNIVYQNNKATASIRRLLGNSTRPENFAMAAELQANNLESRNNLFAAKNLAEVNLRNQQRTLYGQSRLQQGEHRLGRRDKYNLEMGQDEATRQNLTHQGLSEFATNQALFRNDKEKIRMINEISNLYDIDPFVTKSVMDDPKAMNFIQMYMNQHNVSFAEAVEDNYGDISKKSKKTKNKTTD